MARNYRWQSKLARPRTASFRTVLGLMAATIICGCKAAGRTPARVDIQSFSSAFREVREVQIPGVPPSDVVAMTEDSHGAIYVVDSRTVKKFGPDGQFVGVVGEEGWGPGHFEIPWSLTCDEKGDLYVADFEAGRLSIFDSAAHLLDSMTVSGLGFAAIGVRVGQFGNVYVAGLPRPAKPGSALLYRFNTGGQLLTSFFPQDERVTKLHLTVVGGVAFDTDSAGQIYAAQPISPTVSVFSPDGRFIRQFGRVPPFYRPPSEFPDPLPSDHAKVDALLARWTELIGINVISQQGIVLLTFSVHSPVPYAIEVYAEDGRFLTGGIGTSLFPAFADRLGHVYFYDRSQKKLNLIEAAPAFSPMEVNHAD